MEISRAALEGRLQALRTSRERLLVQLHLHDGAIEEVERWLAYLRTEAPAEESA